MSDTIGNLVDRVFREYLEPMDSVESYSYLTGGISSTTQSTLNYEGDLFSSEEEDALDAGAIIEIGQELMFSKSLNVVTNEITVQRGARGTTANTYGTKSFTPDPESANFTAFENLTQEIVVGWFTEEETAQIESV